MTQREQMEAVIKSGCGVLHEGRIITQLEHLPSAEQLAASDAVKRVARQTQIQVEIAKLQAEYDVLMLTDRPAGLPVTGPVADAPPAEVPPAEAPPAEVPPADPKAGADAKKVKP